MSKLLIILTCPECGSGNVTFDGNCTCYCNDCKCKYDVSKNTNVNYIDSMYVALLHRWWFEACLHKNKIIVGRLSAY